MKFFLYLENEDVGYSLLESPDDPMAIILGEFFPNDKYLKHSNIFAQYTKARFSDFPKKVENIEKTIADFAAKIESLAPKIVSESGKILEAYSIVLKDYSIELGEAVYELAALLSRESFDEFFYK